MLCYQEAWLGTVNKYRWQSLGNDRETIISNIDVAENDGGTEGFRFTALRNLVDRSVKSTYLKRTAHGAHTYSISLRTSTQLDAIAPVKEENKINKIKPRFGKLRIESWVLLLTRRVLCSDGLGKKYPMMNGNPFWPSISLNICRRRVVQGKEARGC